MSVIPTLLGSEGSEVPPCGLGEMEAILVGPRRTNIITRDDFEQCPFVGDCSIDHAPREIRVAQPYPHPPLGSGSPDRRALQTRVVELGLSVKCGDHF